jgi:integrase
MRSNIWYKWLNRANTRPHKNGHDRYYFRPKGYRGKLPDVWKMPDCSVRDDRFVTAYAAAYNYYLDWLSQDVVEQPAYVGSLAEAAVKYKSSHEFGLLAPATRSIRRARLDGVIDLYGTAQVCGLEQKHVKKDLSRFSGHAQRNHLKMWRGFAKFLMSEYGIADPTDSVARAKVAHSDGHEPWSMDDIAMYRDAYAIDQSARLAMELLYWTGARCSDACRLGPRHVTKDGWLSFKQSKTGGQVDIPFDRPLPAFAQVDAGDLRMLHACLDAQTDKHMIFLSEGQQRGANRGSHRDEKNLSNLISMRAKGCGLQNRTAHGLRKSRAIRWAELGATSVQIGAYTGHESLKEIERYIKKYNRRAALSGGVLAK